MDPVFLRRIGFHIDLPADASHDYLISAIETACVTEAELNADPESCVARVRAAQEELEPFDLEDAMDFYGDQS